MEVLSRIEPPSPLAPGWSDLLVASAGAVSEQVEIEDLRDRATRLAGGDGEAFSTPFVIEVASSRLWEVAMCFDVAYFEEAGATDMEPLPRCRLETAEPSPRRAQVWLDFARTTDGRWIAWDAA